LGGLGFIWLALWLWRYREPEQCPWISENERQFILEQRDPVSAIPYASRNSAATLLSTLLRQRSVWGLMVTQGCSTYFNYLFLAWLPTYLVQVRGLQLMRAGIYAAIPYVVAVVFVLAFGRLSDRLLAASSLRKGRRRSIIILLLPLCSMIMLINVVRSETAVLVVLAVALSLNLTCLTLNLALTSDLIEDPGMSGMIFAMISTSANLFGLCAPIVTGYIITSTGTFSAAFDVAGGLTIVAAAILFALVRKPIHSVPPVEMRVVPAAD
jgi:ACS family glucarate transporter-like MFS transporter